MRDNPAYRRFEVGRFTYGRPLVMWGNAAHLKVGSFCSIGDGVDILLGGNHRTDWVSTYPFPTKTGFEEVASRTDFAATKGDVLIGNDVWIGQNVIILSGVTIGYGAVIGAASLVAKSIPPYAIAAGNPAKVIRFRFPEEDIASLLKIAWWNWPLDRIKEALPLIMNRDIGSFIASVRSNTASD
jgi:acetyltransferase-like isoleucine patch superfamily enzyme